MEQETLYAAAKWDMLKALESSSKSPLELAERSSTSVSNVSQSLRFLELAGIVQSERISNRDKGQPRVSYSIKGNSAYLIVTAKNFVEKKQVALDDYKKAVLRIWFYKDESIQPFLEKALHNIKLAEVKGVFFDTSSLSELKIVIIPDKGNKKEFKDFTASVQGASRKIKFVISDEAAIQKSRDKYYAIYNPLQLVGGLQT